MKLKYKKLIVLVSLGTMFLSFVILSMVPTGGDTSVNPEDAEVTRGGNKEIVNLMNAYFKAKVAIDMDAVSELVSDVNQVSEEKLKTKAAYLEDCQNLVCHIIENEKQNAYRVYVQYDMKISNINTLAPSLSAYYVKLASDDKYLVYLSALDEEEEEFIEAADKNREIIKLKEDTAVKLQQAINKDAALKQFFVTINKENAPAIAQDEELQNNTQQNPQQQNVSPQGVVPTQ